MKIIQIFEIVNRGLYAVQYENERNNEFQRLFSLWTDTKYLENFFELHKEDLQNSFWKNISIEEAIQITLNEAKNLEKKLINIAEGGKNANNDTLSTLFKPLNNNTTAIKDFEKNKLKGLTRQSWLRLYAIRCDSNLFVISGGAIKLTKTMNERKHLLEELRKLEVTQAHLKEPEDDTLNLDIFELF